jgi:hypothetical protein
MERELSYRDAAVLMGKEPSRTVAMLDRLAGGLLLAAAPVTGGIALSLFEAKNEFIRLNEELLREIGQRARGLNRLSRRDRLEAAHAVIALTAYFDVLAAALPFGARELHLTALPTSTRRVGRNYQHLVT